MLLLPLRLLQLLLLQEQQQRALRWRRRPLQPLKPALLLASRNLAAAAAAVKGACECTLQSLPLQSQQQHLQLSDIPGSTWNKGCGWLGCHRSRSCWRTGEAPRGVRFRVALNSSSSDKVLLLLLLRPVLPLLLKLLRLLLRLLLLPLLAAGFIRISWQGLTCEEA